MKNATETSDVKSGEKIKRSVWFGALNVKTTARDLRQLSRKYGRVLGARILIQKRDKTKLLGQVIMASSEDAKRCAYSLTGIKYKGCILEVTEGTSKLFKTEQKTQETQTKPNASETKEKCSTASSPDSNKQVIHYRQKLRDITRALEKLHRELTYTKKILKCARLTNIRLKAENDEVKKEQDSLIKCRAKLIKMESEHHQLLRENMKLKEKLDKKRLYIETYNKRHMRSSSYKMDENNFKNKTTSFQKYDNPSEKSSEKKSTLVKVLKSSSNNYSSMPERTHEKYRKEYKRRSHDYPKGSFDKYTRKQAESRAITSMQSNNHFKNQFNLYNYQMQRNKYPSVWNYSCHNPERQYFTDFEQCPDFKRRNSDLQMNKIQNPNFCFNAVPYKSPY